MSTLGRLSKLLESAEREDGESEDDEGVDDESYDISKSSSVSSDFDLPLSSLSSSESSSVLTSTSSEQQLQQQQQQQQQQQPPLNLTHSQSTPRTILLDDKDFEDDKTLPPFVQSNPSKKNEFASAEIACSAPAETPSPSYYTLVPCDSTHSRNDVMTRVCGDEEDPVPTLNNKDEEEQERRVRESVKELIRRRGSAMSNPPGEGSRTPAAAEGSAIGKEGSKLVTNNTIVEMRSLESSPQASPEQTPPISIPSMERSPSQASCPICFEDWAALLILPCSHGYCRLCLTSLITTKILERDVDLTCPDVNCRKPLPRELIANLVKEDVLEKHDKFKYEKELLMNPNARFCPNPGCGNIMVCDVSKKSKGKVRCSVCNFAFCFQCKSKWHRGSCGANVSAAEKKNARWKRSHGVRQCPQCGGEYYRRIGCPRMQCGHCGVFFSDNTGRILKGGQGEGIVEGSMRLPQQFYWVTEDAKDYIRERPPGQSKTMRYVKATGLLFAEWLMLLLIGLPVLAVAGPPVLLSRLVRKTGRLLSCKPSSERRKSSPSVNFEKPAE